MGKMDMRKYDDPARSTRRWITFGLVLGGAVAGAAFGIVLTPLGKIVAGASPADTANYIWNAWMFAAFGAGLAPLVTWSGLRRVPLWPTIADPSEAPSPPPSASPSPTAPPEPSLPEPGTPPSTRPTPQPQP